MSNTLCRVRACSALLCLLTTGLPGQAQDRDAAAGAGLYVTGQQGPVVVLQAGLGDRHDTWDALVQRLAADFRVVTLDRPGQGRMPAAPGPRDPCTQADELTRRLRAAGLRPPYLLVGHSLGGRYAWAQAQRFPQETAGLVLVDATPPGHWQRMRSETPAQALLLKALRLTAFDAVSRQEFDDQDGCMDTLTQHPTFSAPTIVLASGRRRPEETPDFAALLTRGQALWPALTGAEGVEVVGSAGHHIHQDAPEVVAVAVRRVAARAAEAR